MYISPLACLTLCCRDLQSGLASVIFYLPSQFYSRGSAVCCHPLAPVMCERTQLPMHGDWGGIRAQVTLAEITP